MLHFFAAAQDTRIEIAPPRGIYRGGRMKTGGGTGSSSASVLTLSPAALEAIPFASSVIPAHYVAEAIPRRFAVSSELFPIVTPLRPKAWQSYLEEANLLANFSDVVHGLTYGFSRGINTSVARTCISANHPSALANIDFIDSLISSDIANSRYSNFYDPVELELLIGPFLTSPLAVVVKPNTGKKRLVQNHSYPCNNTDIPSVNLFIDASKFKCDWGTFTDCFLIVARAPPGTQASVFDVDSAFRNIPSLWSKQSFFCISWKLKIIIDHVYCFGDCSVPGICGRVADTICRIYLSKGIGAVLKWVDDFVFFQ